MKIRVVTDRPWQVPADVLVVPVLDEASLAGAAAELDRRTGGHLGALIEFGELATKRFSTVLAGGGTVGGDGSRAAHLMAVRAGDPAALDRETVVKVAATAERRLSGRSVKVLAVWLDPLASLEGGLVAAAELVARGVVEGSYDPQAIYRDEPTSPPQLDELVLVATDAAGLNASIAAAAERGQVIGEGANIARTLSNRASNDVSPEVLAEEAYGLAKQHGLWIDVIGPDKATQLGMGMFMAVGRGSDNPPRMIVMRSGKEGARDKLDRHLALVGKGVCFDSGGISLKPGDRMDEMKMDKTGAATVIAALVTVKRLSPETPLLAVAPAVENMPGPHSTRPGDVVRALNGKQVDITNTDAEGRLILGDAMTYAERLGATHIVDIATLTGAVGRALGDLMAGAFGTPQPWVDAVQAAARQAGERYWQLPLVDEYRADMDSWYGDIVNFARNNEGGLVKSALFLREFRTKPWVHLDIAGTSSFSKTKPFAPKGANGFGHATLVELALAGAIA